MKRQTRKHLLPFLLLLALLLSATSTYAKNTLWQVRSGDNILYLLGALHVLKQDSYPLNSFIEEVYAASTTLVFETDMDEMDTPAMQQKILSYGRLPTGRTLEQELTPSTWQRLQTKIDAMGLPLTAFKPLRTWLCALTLTVVELEKLGFLPEYGVDQYFYEKAKKDGKVIIPLESVEFQLSLFFSQSRREQEDLLNQTLADLTIIDSLANELEGAWKTGDGPKLHNLISASFQSYPQQYERMVLQRNKNWLPVLEKIIKNNKLTLVVVGAGHLVGPNSVVELLREKGYKVVQR